MPEISKDPFIISFNDAVSILTPVPLVPDVRVRELIKILTDNKEAFVDAEDFIYRKSSAGDYLKELYPMLMLLEMDERIMEIAMKNSLADEVISWIVKNKAKLGNTFMVRPLENKERKM